MNMRCVAGFALAASMEFAAETPLAGSDEKIELPVLSLKEAAREKLPKPELFKMPESETEEAARDRVQRTFNPPSAGMEQALRAAPRVAAVTQEKDYTVKRLSPGADVDPKFVVKLDESTRYTLIIKKPDEVEKIEK